MNRKETNMTRNQFIAFTTATTTATIVGVGKILREYLSNPTEKNTNKARYIAKPALTLWTVVTIVTKTRIR